MKTKSLMASFAIILITLSTVGFAYSSWSDSIKIEAYVEMGEFIVGILTDPLPPDWGPDPVRVYETTNGYPELGPAPPKEDPGGFVPKDVCDTEVEIWDYRVSVHHTPTQTVAHEMYISVDNAYPQYDAHIEFLLKNAGTIPAHIRIVFDYADVWYQGAFVRDLEVRESGWMYNGLWHNKGDLYDPVLKMPVINWELELAAPFNPDYPETVQLEPCNAYLAHIHFDFKQDAEQCHTYKFGFHVDAIQWNMDYEWDL